MNSSSSDFSNISIWLRSLHGTIIGTLLVVSVTGNSFLLLIFFRNKKLQSRSTLVSLGLVVADLLLAVIWSAQSITNIVAGHNLFETFSCSFLGSSLETVIHARWCTVALIILDRFCNIFFPFIYLRYSKPFLIILTVLCWFIPAFMATPWLAGFGIYEFRIQQSSCTIICDYHKDQSCFYYYTIVHGLFVVIGTLLPIALYLVMCVYGYHKSYKMKHIVLGTNDRSREVNNRNNEEITTMNSKKQNRIDMKPLQTFIIIFVSIVFTQLPIYVVNSLRNARSIYLSIPLPLHFVLIYIYLLGSVLDPLLIMRNRDFRIAIKNMLRKKSRMVSFQQKSNTAEVIFKIASLQSRSVGPKPPRRYSCPNILENRTPANLIAPLNTTRAGSFEGCKSLSLEVIVEVATST